MHRLGRELQLPLMFLSTAFMQADLMPAWMRAAALDNPVHWAISAGREAMQPQPDWMGALGHCGLLAAFAMAALVVATRALRGYRATV